MESPRTAPYFFSSHPIAVGIRHEVEQVIREEYSKELSIIDGIALAESLAEPDIFWIAHVYLSVPKELYPEEVSEQEDWYSEELKIWKQQNPDSTSPGHFYALKRLVRHATFNQSCRADIPFILDKLRVFSDGTTPRLVSMSLYEQIVGRLRGLDSLIGHSDSIQRYFDHTKEIHDTNTFRDRSIIFSYLSTAIKLGASDFDTASLTRIGKDFLADVDEHIPEAQDSPNRYCCLKDYQGRVEAALALSDRKSLDEWVDRTIKRWMEVAEWVEDAPLYPISSLSECLTEMAHVIDEHPDYLALVGRIDDVMAKRFGGYRAAQSCAGRAFALHNSGKTLKAIIEIQSAKSKWFGEESLGHFCRSLMLLAEWYVQLGLPLAAKQYALASIYAAANSDDADLKMLAYRSTNWLANVQYGFGNFMEYFTLLLASFALRNHVPDADISDEEQSEEETQTELHAAVALSLLMIHEPFSFKIMEEDLRESGLINFVSQSAQAFNEKYHNLESDDVWDLLCDNLRGHPKQDFGIDRISEWRALGIQWKLSWKNDFEISSIVEGWAAAIQILLAGMGGRDFLLLPTKIQLRIEVTDVTKPEVDRLPNNTQSDWVMRVPSASFASGSAAVADYTKEILIPIVHILRDVSLEEHDTFFTKVEDWFRTNLVGELQIVRPYNELYTYLVPNHLWYHKARVRGDGVFSDREWNLDEHEELAWFSSLAPQFDEEKEKIAIKNRYNNGLIVCRKTLELARGSEGFARIIGTLRTKGWKNWHIIQAISNLVFNYHAGALDGPPFDHSHFMSRMKEVQERFSSGVEFEAMPLEYLTEEWLRQMIYSSYPPTLHACGLRMAQQTPDLDAIDRFMRDRLRYWDMDVECAEASQLLPE